MGSTAIIGMSGRWAELVPYEVASLIEEFHYPRRGPGMMYDAMADRVEKRRRDSPPPA